MTLKETAKDIKSMKIRGAGKIARSAADALKQEAVSYKGRDVIALRKRMEEGKAILLSSRPTAISLDNAVQLVMRDTMDISSVKEYRNRIIINADAFIKSSKEAVEIIGHIGSRRLKGGEKILTHCNSTAALSVIKTAHAEGKEVEVFATESRPWRQGLLTVRDLAKADVPVTLIVDGAVRSIMKEIDVVFVGADTVCANGTVINKIGTSQIALIAKEARVPFIVCAETYKFSPKTLQGDMVVIEERDPSEVATSKEIPPKVRIRNPVFDATPSGYIDSIVTETGMISPCAAYDVIINKFGTGWQQAMERESI